MRLDELCHILVTKKQTIYQTRAFWKRLSYRRIQIRRTSFLIYQIYEILLQKRNKHHVRLGFAGFLKHQQCMVILGPSMLNFRMGIGMWFVEFSCKKALWGCIFTELRRYYPTRLHLIYWILFIPWWIQSSAAWLICWLQEFIREPKTQKSWYSWLQSPFLWTSSPKNKD